MSAERAFAVDVYGDVTSGADAYRDGVPHAVGKVTTPRVKVENGRSHP
jgi:hypothetical protein